MRLIKMALLAATATVAVMAFVGTSAALATGTWIGLCKAAELLNCAKANLIKHPLKAKLRILVNKGFFLSNLKVSCELGLGESNLVEAQQQASFKGSLEIFKFIGCSGDCSVVMVRTPQPVEINMETEAGSDWRLKAANMKVAFSSCVFGGECEFEGTLNLKVQMDGEGAYADPEGAAFTLIKGSALLCGATGKWETGRMRFDWVLDNDPVTVHKNITPSLIGKSLVAT